MCDKVNYATQEVHGMVAGRDRSCRVPLKERAMKKRAHLSEELQKQDQIISILEKHPEFEEFDQLRELLESERRY